MRQFKIYVNMEKRYDDIWDVDAYPDYFDEDFFEFNGKEPNAEDIIDQVVCNQVHEMYYDERQALEDEGITDYLGLIDKYAWKVDEVITDEYGCKSFVEIGKV